MATKPKRSLIHCKLPQSYGACLTSFGGKATFSPAIFYLITCAMLWGTVGCESAKYYPVSGVVLDTNGNVIEGLEGAQIEFENPELGASAVGEILADGRYSLFTEEPGDGAQPGHYRVLIARKFISQETAAPRVIAKKYEQLATSGLSAEVEQKKNKINFRVERIAQGEDQPLPVNR